MKRLIFLIMVSLVCDARPGHQWESPASAAVAVGASIAPGEAGVLVCAAGACPPAEPLGGDVCEANGRYGDGRCDLHCPALDPDCAEQLAADVDRDGDGLSDAEEERIARDYLPHLALHPDEGCAQAALIYRLRPHPRSGRLLHMTAVVLFEDDCGAAAHSGDNEVFGMTIDPDVPAPAGIVTLRTIAHQNTLCTYISACGSCAGMRGCETRRHGGRDRPVIYYSRNKHGAYLDVADCDGACFWTNYCSERSQIVQLPLLNVGEPSAPLTRDLGAARLLTLENGWTRLELLDFDPWSGEKFGAAGRVTADLTNPAFVTETCEAPPARLVRAPGPPPPPNTANTGALERR